MSSGWVCPACARVWAPHIGSCSPCNQATPVVRTYENAGPRILPVHPSRWNYTADDVSYT